MLTERPLGASDEIEEVVHALRLRLCVTNERGTQAPVLCTRTLGEVDEPGEPKRFDVGGHDEQRTSELVLELRADPEPREHCA